MPRHKPLAPFKEGILMLAIGVIGIIVAVCYNLWRDYKQIDELVYKKLAGMESKLTHTFDYTHSVLQIMSRTIRVNYEDPNYISSLLRDYSYATKSAYSSAWTIFSWANNQHYITVDAFFGIMEQPYDLSSRDYITYTVQHPGILHLGKPVYGSTSRRWMIPGGLGVTDIDGTFIGTLTIGFDIEKITQVLQGETNSDSLQFALLNLQGEPVIKSDPTLQEFDQVKITASPNYPSVSIRDFISSDLKFSKQDGRWAQTDHRFYFYRVQGYPYILYANLDSSFIFNELLRSSVQKSGPLIAFLVIVITLFFIARYRQNYLMNRIHSASSLLKRASVSKEEFLSQIVFELRNPLSMVISISETMQQETFGTIPEHYKNFIKDIELYSRDALDFIDDVSDLSHASSLSHAFQVVPFDIGAIIRRSMNQNMSLSMHRQIRLQSHIEHQLPKLLSDPKRIKQILNHFIRNAISVSNNFSTITVGAKSHEDKVEVFVADKGLGLTSSEIDILLGKQHILDGSPSTHINPTGLGLKLVAHLCQNLGIDFSIESEKGQGTRMILRFPKEKIDWMKDRSKL
ncbi:MAG: hypothetical protein IPP74_04145 [Alphaproteobacteria bacterium]|nr:hypothetical protein [Alphaproteobacteria bacterium]